MSATRPPLDVAPLTLLFPTASLSWPQVFGNDRPVELEIGPGKGLFLANAAAARPDHNFLGVEMARKYALRTVQRLAKARLENIRVVVGDGRRLLALFVAPGSLAAVHIYFPDPWWKKRHRKRRVFCPEFVDDAARAIRPGGTFAMATDVEEYGGVMRAIMAVRPDFDPEEPPVSAEPRHDLDYLTNFERKYRLEGRAIYRAQYRRNDRPAAVAVPAVGDP